MKAYLSALAARPLTKFLENLGYQLHFMTGARTPVYDAVKTHADIHMCRLGVWEDVQMFMGDPARLTEHYPGNIIYNAVCTGKYFIHNLKYTDPALLAAARAWKSAENGSAGSCKSAPCGSAGSCKSAPCGSAAHAASAHALTLVDVPQGYTRCCCLPVDDTSFITSDEGIARPLTSAGADVLLIKKGHVLLPGFDYGFIGGCAGHIWIDPPAGDSSPPEQSCARTSDECAPHPGRHTIIFNGDLSAHPDFDAIADFLQIRRIDAVFFREYPLTDIGSIPTIR